MNAVALARPMPLRRVSEQRHVLVQTAHVRLMMVMLLFAAAIALVLGKLAVLAIMAQPPVPRDPDAVLAPAREDIVDRNGVPLARTIDMWAIGVHPEQLIGDRREIARKMAAILPDHDAAWYFAAFSRRRFAYLEHRATPELVNRINAELGQPGIVAEREPMRLYPQGQLAAHALGFVDVNGVGQEGMEKALDTRLLDPSHRDTPLALSLDARVQGALENELGTAMATFRAKGAAGVVMDVRTGEVIAMASLPFYNPNRPGDLGPKQFDAKGRELPNARFNRVTQAVYELGSTFKPITVATALDTGVVSDISRRFDATAPLHVGRFTIHDEVGDPKRWLNMPETLIYSSNIATARIADELGPERLQAMFRKLGLDTRPAIELRETARPLWPAFWARTTTMTTAYGHGIAITPLQLAAAYSALVNGGIWRPSTLLKVGAGHPVAPGRRVISEATSYRMRQMLRLIVLKGTGRKGDAPGYRLGGKTGTGEIPTAGGYDHSRNMATFVAAFPIEQPRYVVLSMLDSPQATKETFGWKTAAWNAAPVVGRVVSRVGPLLGVLPDANRDIDESDLLPLLFKTPDEKQADAN